MRHPRTPLDQIEWMRNLLAFLLIGAFIGAMGAFTVFVIPTDNRDILTYMIGQLSGMATTVLGFFFINKVGQDALDARRADNTSKLADLAATAIKATGDPALAEGEAAQETADAAQEKADAIKGDKP